MPRTRARFLVLHDPDRRVADLYAPSSMPTSFVIDRQGVLRHINRGFDAAGDDTKFERQILALLGNGAGPGRP